MRTKTRKRLTLLLALCALLLAAAAPQTAAASGGVTLVSNTGFPDVPRGAWYEDAMLKMQNYTPGIISGVKDADGVTRFHPDWAISRIDFLKMAMVAAEGYTTDRSRSDYWGGLYYTIAMENNILVVDAYSGSEPVIPYDITALEQPITRYEAAVILSNTCTNMQMETAVVVNNAASHIADYDAIRNYTPDVATINRGGFTRPVEQVIGKGMLYLRDDGTFAGEETVSRAQAAAVIYRLQNWKGSRETPSWASEPELTTASQIINKEESFAFWLQDGHLNGSTPDAEARELLFGDANKSYFTSAAEAEPYLKLITVPIWAIDKTGNKYPTTGSLSVHKLVADEVQLIFEQIYNDPERYPIYGYSIGGARFSDALRHSWGCAIDINPYFNCECNFRSGGQVVTCGYGWWPAGMDGLTWVGRDASVYHGSLTEPSPYSIGPNSSVVRAFAAYGWGWGGSGSNIIGEQKGWSSGRAFDFMHFSVLPSGG